MAIVTYIVQRGDTLYAIAKKFYPKARRSHKQALNKAREIARGNRIPNINQIYPGQALVLKDVPVSSTALAYDTGGGFVPGLSKRKMPGPVSVSPIRTTSINSPAKETSPSFKPEWLAWGLVGLLTLTKL